LVPGQKLRKAQAFGVKTPSDASFDVINLHAPSSRKNKLTDLRRLAQIESIMQKPSACHNRVIGHGACIIGGDFNTKMQRLSLIMDDLKTKHLLQSDASHPVRFHFVGTTRELHGDITVCVNIDASPAYSPATNHDPKHDPVGVRIRIHPPHDPYVATERMDLKTSEVSLLVADARYFPDTRGEHVATERMQTTATKATSASMELPNAASATQHRVTVSAEAPEMLTYDDHVWSTDSEALPDATANEDLYCSIALVLWNANIHSQHVEDIIKETILEEASAGMNAIVSLETISQPFSLTRRAHQSWSPKIPRGILDKLA
jgi:hypothetical protein